MKKKKRSTETNLSREDFIRKETRKTLFFFDLVVLVIGLVSILLISIFNGISPKSFLQMILTIFLLIIIVNLASIKFLSIFAGNVYARTISIDILNKSLSSEKYTEIIPLHRIYEHSYFLVSLTNIAKFFAIVKNESEVSIYVQFNAENELRFLEDILKTNFHTRYKLK